MNKAALILTALAAISDTPLMRSTKNNREQKNKYNLNENQIELIKNMTPKEKKKYFKSIKKEIG
jgi:hypothetical protein